MARTVNPVAHGARRDAILDAGERLIATHGYDATTLNDVLMATGISKGAFYHYFSSKDDLLEGMLTRRLEGWTAAVTEVASGEGTATHRLRELAKALGAAKTSDRPLLVRAMPRVHGTGNAAVLVRLRRGAVERFLPILVDVVDAGVRAGEFTVSSVEGTSRVVLSLLLEYSDTTSRHLLAIARGEEGPEPVERDARAYSHAIQAVLGAEADGDFIEVPDLEGWLRAIATIREES